MRAYWYEKAGSAYDVLKFGEIQAPIPGRGEVRVKIAVSAVNPTDGKRRISGRELGKFQRIIPNNDGAGTIESVGEGVSKSRIGQRVWIFGAQANRPFGTAAEYCVVPDIYARLLYDEENFSNGACLGVPAVTAHHALFADGNINGHTVFISGGSGRVGRYAVQMAKFSGAIVIASAGSMEKCLHTKNLGADYVLNYNTDDIVSEVLKITDGRGVDRMVDVEFGLNAKIAPKLIRANGNLTVYGSDGAPTPSIPFLEFMYKNIAIKPFSIFGMPEIAKTKAFDYIDKILRKGTLDHRIDSEHTFNEMIDAHHSIDSMKLFGCCLVKIEN